MAGLYRLFQFSACISSPFRQKLNEKEVILVMKSKDDRISRTFRFQDNRVRSKSGPSQDAICKLIWKTPERGAKIMIDIGMGKPRAIEKAIMKGDLMLEGDAVSIKWFLEVIGKVRSIYFRRK